MKLNEEIRIAMETFMKMKASMCQVHKGPYDLAPMLHLKYQHLNGYCGVLLAGEGHPMNLIPSAWEKIVENGIPEFVIAMIEGYASKNENPQNYRRGQMEEDFKNNPDSTVVEVLNIQAIDIKTGNQISGFVSFKYNDKGQPEFEIPEYSPCEGESLNANIPRIFSLCRDATLEFMRKAV
jgi:hypothetical protein